jgi:hypothetical protein
MVITNLHPYPLTALIVQTDPTAPNSITNTLVFDALTHVGLLAPVPDLDRSGIQRKRGN